MFHIIRQQKIEHSSSDTLLYHVVGFTVRNKGLYGELECFYMAYIVLAGDMMIFNFQIHRLIRSTISTMISQ
jgi:hypothetical protein